MNNLEMSLKYEYSPFGKDLANVANAVLPLIEKSSTLISNMKSLRKSWKKWKKN